MAQEFSSGEAGLLVLPECVGIAFDSTVFHLMARLLICSVPRSGLKQGICDLKLTYAISVKHVNAASP